MMKLRDILNALGAADAAAVARLQTTKRNCLLAHECFFGCVDTLKLLVNKGATKDIVHPGVDCYSYLLDHFDAESTDAHKMKATEGLALLVMLGMPIASGWTRLGARSLRRPNWVQLESELRRVLDTLLSTLEKNDDTSALTEHLITSLDIKGREKDGQVLDVSVCQFDSVAELMPDNTPEWLLALVATIFSKQYEQGGAAIAQEMRPIITNHFNFDIPA
jgi:hypothetical protein